MQISEPAEYALLGLLEERPMHGYEMFQQFQQGVLGQIVRIEMSQLYAFLKKLERLKLIEASLEQQGARPPRRVYCLTTPGKNLLHNWMLTPVERPREIRIFFLLKLYFVQRLLPAQLARIIEQEISACSSFLKGLESQQRSAYSIHSPETFDQIILQSRIYQTRALVAWLRELQAEFAQSH